MPVYSDGNGIERMIDGRAHTGGHGSKNKVGGHICDGVTTCIFDRQVREFIHLYIHTYGPTGVGRLIRRIHYWTPKCRASKMGRCGTSTYWDSH